MKLSKMKLNLSMARAKMNLYDIAVKADMSTNTLSAVFQRCSCKPATAGKIAEALGVDVTEIIETE